MEHVLDQEVFVNCNPTCLLDCLINDRNSEEDVFICTNAEWKCGGGNRWEFATDREMGENPNQWTMIAGSLCGCKSKNTLISRCLFVEKAQTPKQILKKEMRSLLCGGEQAKRKERIVRVYESWVLREEKLASTLASFSGQKYKSAVSMQPSSFMRLHQRTARSSQNFRLYPSLCLCQNLRQKKKCTERTSLRWVCIAFFL